MNFLIKFSPEHGTYSGYAMVSMVGSFLSFFRDYQQRFDLADFEREVSRDFDSQEITKVTEEAEKRAKELVTSVSDMLIRRKICENQRKTDFHIRISDEHLFSTFRLRGPKVKMSRNH